MADFLSRLVERTFSKIQVAEPLITPSFVPEPASIMEHKESSVFDFKPPYDSQKSPEGAIQKSDTIYHPHPEPLAYENQMDHGQSLIAEDTEQDLARDIHPFNAEKGNKSTYRAKPGSLHEMRRDTEHDPAGDINSVNSEKGKTAYHIDSGSLHEMHMDTGHDLAGDINFVNSEKGKTISHIDSGSLHEMRMDTGHDPAGDINFVNSEKGKTTYRIEPGSLHEMHMDTGRDPAGDIHAFNDENRNKSTYHADPGSFRGTQGDTEQDLVRNSHVIKGDNRDMTVNHLQPKTLIHENMVKDESDITKSRNAQIGAAEKKAYAEKSKVLNNINSDLHVLAKLRTLEPQADSLDPERSRKSEDNYQLIETGIQSEVSLAAGSKLLETVTLTDSAEKEMLRQTSRKGGSNILNQKSREVQSSPDSTTPGIKVTIGHIEVRAMTPPAHVSAPHRQNPVLSLHDYLKKRNGTTL